jgi:hypothetical protein
MVRYPNLERVVIDRQRNQRLELGNLVSIKSGVMSQSLQRVSVEFPEDA